MDRYNQVVEIGLAALRYHRRMTYRLMDRLTEKLLGDFTWSVKVLTVIALVVLSDDNDAPHVVLLYASEKAVQGGVEPCTACRY